MPNPPSVARLGLEDSAAASLLAGRPSVGLCLGLVGSAGVPTRAEQGALTPRLQEARPTTKRSGRAIEAGLN